jgi:hypothetical protein
MILAIDPGNVESAYVLVEDDLSRVVEKGKVENFELVDIILRIRDEHSSLEHIAIEMIASYGMAVGKTVFETCVWIGRFAQLIRVEFGVEPEFIYRSEEKMCLCHSMKAKDSNIRQALIDRFGEVGTKKNPGYFYGFKKDIWSAMAVAVTYHEKFIKE